MVFTSCIFFLLKMPCGNSSLFYPLIHFLTISLPLSFTRISVSVSVSHSTSTKSDEWTNSHTLSALETANSVFVGVWAPSSSAFSPPELYSDRNNNNNNSLLLLLLLVVLCVIWVACQPNNSTLSSANNVYRKRISVCYCWWWWWCGIGLGRNTNKYIGCTLV